MKEFDSGDREAKLKKDPTNVPYFSACLLYDALLLEPNTACTTLTAIHACKDQGSKE